jgi:hypothetical protein
MKTDETHARLPGAYKAELATLGVVLRQVVD